MDANDHKTWAHTETWCDQICQSWIPPSLFSIHLGGGNFLYFIVKIKAWSKWMPELNFSMHRRKASNLYFSSPLLTALLACVLTPCSLVHGPHGDSIFMFPSFLVPLILRHFLQTVYSFWVLSSPENNNIDLCLGVNSW